jgi:hypothetical protein
VVPAPQENPDSFIHHNEQLGWHLRPVDEDPSDDPEDFTWCTKLEVGQIVDFSAHRDFGDFELIVASDGSYSTNVPIPEEANLYRLDRDNDTVTDEISTLVECGLDGSGLGEGSYEMNAYFWSPSDHRFRFEIVEEKGTLVPCGTIQ